jgi:hypothetical protein
VLYGQTGEAVFPSQGSFYSDPHKGDGVGAPRLVGLSCLRESFARVLADGLEQPVARLALAEVADDQRSFH